MRNLNIVNVKGFVGDFFKSFMKYRQEIQNFAMSVTGKIPTGSSVKSTIDNFLNEITENNVDILIRQTYFKIWEQSREDPDNTTYYEQKLTLFKDLIRRTLNLELDDNGEVFSIFPTHTQDRQRIYIEIQLQNLGFSNILNDFQHAFQVFLSSGRAALDLLRGVYESLVREMVNNLEGRTLSNFKDNLIKLESHKVLIEHTGQPKPNQELDLAYNFFGLLSKYGAHASHTDPDMDYCLFLEVVGWMYLLLKRYENIT